MHNVFTSSATANSAPSFRRPLRFSKMHMLGNDFMLIDAITQRVGFSAEWVRQLADRHRGIGFDQLLVLEPPYDPELDFHYRIFNADGREVTQCGNGACCLAHFVYRQGLTNRREIRISTQGSRMLLTLLAGTQVQVTLEEPRFEPKQIPFHAQRAEKHYILWIEDQTVCCGVVSMGNPHCVIQVDQCATAPLAQLGPVVSHHERFPQQTNVSFMQIINPHHIHLRVYERGVGETQACGSGACGAVAVGLCQGLLAEKVQVDLPGGTLQVRWKGPGNPLYLMGSVSHVYDGFLQW